MSRAGAGRPAALRASSRRESPSRAPVAREHRACRRPDVSRADEVVALRDLRKWLGLSDALYEEYLELSAHRCWLCGEPERVEGRRLAVDHDHVTGAIRGLLCTKCNVSLGYLGDDVSIAGWLRRAADYLEGARREFSDACERCRRSTPPATVVEVDPEGSTVFGYVCESCSLRWTCIYETRGVPLAWKLGGVPVPEWCRE